MHNFNTLPIDGPERGGVGGVRRRHDGLRLHRPRATRVEIAHNDPHGANTWSAYWYNGKVYTNDTGRGTDVMQLSDKARAGAKRLPYLNPQTQERAPLTLVDVIGLWVTGS